MVTRPEKNELDEYLFGEVGDCNIIHHLQKAMTEKQAKI